MITRHIQLKVGRLGGSRDAVSVNLRLTDKPSGCVVWIMVDDDLHWRDFLWFGGQPGESLPDISAMRVVKHAKGTAEGVKNERPNHRLIKRSQFVALGNLDALLFQLLGVDIVRPNAMNIYVSAARSADFLYDDKGLPL